MIKCVRTDSGNPDFQKLVMELDRDLRIRDGEDHSFYAQFNKIDMIRHVVVAMEVKRMFVSPEKRGKGIASQALKELETWAKELNMKRCILETGKKQPEAIALYKKSRYAIIPNFGQYEGIEDSVCFEKELV
jgi:putative acetyltransferase